jgi:hypothetical protein
VWKNAVVAYGVLLSLDLSVEAEKTTKKIRKDNTRLKNFFYLMAKMVYLG